RMNTSEIDLKSQFKRGMAVEQFIDDQIAQKITISRKEVKMYYDSHPDNFKKPEQVKASHILIKVDPQADESQKKEARKKLDAIKQKLKKGEDFSTLAREFSQCPSSSRGGDLSYFGREQMVKPFSDAAFALKTGEVSDIIETRFGYHLIKVTDRKSETKISYQDAKEKVEQYLKQKKIFKEVNQYLEKVKRKAKIETFL
ncbi:MAG: peptidylprolyl isomerase, partial [Thermodesulfobacteriota bacterium]|nr:peptidylprolyl isomerase [Thermodesulfobacteriota bacterium]